MAQSRLRETDNDLVWHGRGGGRAGLGAALYLAAWTCEHGRAFHGMAARADTGTQMGPRGRA